MKCGHRLLTGALVAVALVLAPALMAPWGQDSLAQGNIIYVDADATSGNNDGTSWVDAYTDLQAALDVALVEDEIWVAEGIYRPTVEHGGTGDRYKSFQMKNGVAIYGGFAGIESSLEERDWVNHVTILSGDLGTEGDASDNSYHVFYHPDELALDGSAVLDGFTITGGNADGAEWPSTHGGGLYNSYASSPVVTNCTFSGNWARYGGGMGNRGASSPVVTNCTFLDNSAQNGGGGMYNSDSSSPVVTDSTFSGNSAWYGGGMYNWYSWPVVTNCTFSGNSVDYYGGGMYNHNSSSAVVTNCTFWGNSAGWYGGGMLNRNSSPIVTNSILWGDSPDDIYNDASEPVVTYSNIQGDYSGEGNINAAPLFVAPTNGDFHLAAGSPCIDVGNNAAADLPLYDFESDDRILDGDDDGTATVDMGVDEFVPEVPVDIDIKPGDYPNSINLGSKGVVPVVVLTTDEFDASTIDPASVLFAGASPLRWAIEDVDCDGDLELVFHFDTQELELDESSTEATLAGQTFDGMHIQGTDTVNIVP
jgi:parallel beta-helix repeat protein